MYALYEVLKYDHELFVVDNDSERSVVGHAFTLVDSLRVRSVNPNGSFFDWLLMVHRQTVLSLRCITPIYFNLTSYSTINFIPTLQI